MLVLRVIALVAVVSAQKLIYYPNPKPIWTYEQGAQIGPGNGLFLSPDGSQLVCTGLDGSVHFIDPNSGAPVSAPFEPKKIFDFTVRGFGGITFSMGGTTPYMTYAITDDYLNDATTRVIALTMGGEKIFESIPLPGVQAGSPVTSSDGRYIYLTHNVDGKVGYFSMLDTTQLSGDDALAPMYQNYNDTNPFSPIGIFHNPAEGYYDGGQDNTNDMLVWKFDTREGAIYVGQGQMFGFQMPVDDNSPIGYFLLGGSQNFQASTPPQLTNYGRSMYWALTRALQSAWVGAEGSNKGRFNRGRTQSIGYTRGSPFIISSRAPPSFSSSPTEPTVYGPGASTELWRADYQYESSQTVETSGVISSKVLVSPDDRVIYYADQNGVVAQLNAETLETGWQLEDFDASYEGENALSADGSTLFIGDASGSITAYEVAQAQDATAAPSSSTVSPAGMPSLEPTQAWSETPSWSPVVIPLDDENSDM